MPEEKKGDQEVKGCPMRKWEDDFDNTGFDDCVGKYCAWWHEEDERCVLISINSNLFGIGISVTGIQ